MKIQVLKSVSVLTVIHFREKPVGKPVVKKLGNNGHFKKTAILK